MRINGSGKKGLFFLYVCLIFLITSNVRATTDLEEDIYSNNDIVQPSGAMAEAPDNWTPLHAAVDNGSIQEVKALMASGADVNAVTLALETPLHIVGRNEEVPKADQIEMAKLLIAAGADVNARLRETGMTPLFFADRELAEVLVEAGADIHAKSLTGFTPVQWLSYWNAYETVAYLLSQGAEVSYQGSSEGKSALHIAAQFGYVETVKVLLKAGADVNLKDKNGETPLFLAVLEGGPEVQMLLTQSGASPLSEEELQTISMLLAR